MKIIRGFYLLLLLLFTILGCQNQTNFVTQKPDSVVFVPKTHPMDATENGIDSVPEGDGIFINWYDFSDEEEWQYRIYRSVNKNTEFTLINTVSDTFHIDEGREILQTYYYYVTAVNEDNEESDVSDTLHYTLLWKSEPTTPQGAIDDIKPEFMWQDNNQPQYFILRLNRVEDDALIWMTRVELEFGAEHQKVKYNYNNTASISELDRSVTYKWRVDAIGADQFTDSESQWLAFNY